MKVNITARHLKLTPAIADYVEKKIERVARHFKAVIRAQVILSVEKHRQIAEVICHSQGHHDFRAKGVSIDVYAALDLVIEKLHKHMARQKDKRVRGRRVAKSSILEASALPSSAESQAKDVAREVPVSEVRRFVPKPMTVEEAVDELEDHDLNFLVFLNHSDVKVLFKQKDKTYGILELN